MHACVLNRIQNSSVKNVWQQTTRRKKNIGMKFKATPKSTKKAINRETEITIFEKLSLT